VSAATPTLAAVASFPSLLRAFHRARRAKRGRGGEPAFYLHLEDALLDLSEELLEGRYRPDPYRYFTLRNRKERVVAEASFRDRVVHHALVAALEPSWERRYIEHSYACRIGKGTHAAVTAAQVGARRARFFLRMDVRRYFDAIDHQVLFDLLAAEVSDPALLSLCGTLMDAAAVPSVPPGERRGLPIGNLTSQFWANVYLDPLDHHVTRTLRPGLWLRYMDDMLAFADEKPTLWRLAEEVTDFARDTLRLTMKRRATFVAPVHDGVPWLGRRVFPSLIRLDRVNRLRVARALSRPMPAHPTDRQLCSLRSRHGLALGADTQQWVRAALTKTPLA